MPTKKLVVSITGRKKKDWQNKLQEINNYRIREIGLFMEIFTPPERAGLLEALKNSCVKKIPLVHIKSDTTKKEMTYLKKNFQTKFFTIHESHFPILKRWHGFYKNLYLEMNTDNQVAKYVKVEKIGGFCVDLAHFKKEVTKQTKEYRYIIEEMEKVKFVCNHISGYYKNRNADLHAVKSVRDFDYLATLPHNLFGRVMAFEFFNSIKEQLKYKKLLKISLAKKFGFKII